MSEIKLNMWTWGVVPKLHDFAVVVTGGDIKQTPTRPWLPFWYCSLHPKQSDRWYAVLSLGPPELPEEELRLPDGWEVLEDRAVHCGRDHFLRVEKDSDGTCRHWGSHAVIHPTRAECVREINRLLEGKRC